MSTVKKFFDKLEDKTRAHLSHYPIAYAVLGGVCIVIFWRGVWHTVDELAKLGRIWEIVFSGPFSVVVSVFILLITGLFVSFFIGDRIILSGIMREKKVVEKTEAEVRAESVTLTALQNRLEQIEKQLTEIKETLLKR